MCVVYALAYTLLNLCVPGIHKFRSIQINFSSKMYAVLCKMVLIALILGPDLPLLFKLRRIWSVDSQENHYNCCHQMSDFTAKMHETPLGELTSLPQTT